MSIFSKFKKRTVSGELTGNDKSALAWFMGTNSDGEISVPGYSTLSHNPEIISGVGKIAKLIGSMTIHLMCNGKNGDIRIQNELSKHIDIHPNRYMSRATWMYDIVRTTLLDGDGNAVVVPMTENGLIGDLVKVPPGYVSFQQDGYGYKILISGKAYDPSQLLHFVENPDPEYPWRGQGYKVALKDVADNLRQASGTESAFMKSKWKPSVIVKVDGLTEEFANPEGRQKLLHDYVETNEAGEPWLIPSDAFSVEQVKPLSLSDLAISDTVTLDKKTVASILGVPPFLLGAGEYSTEEWNNFINSTIMPIAVEIQQELTRKLLISPDWYFKFNIKSLYNYDIEKLENVYSNLYVRGISSGNEVRDVLGMAPREGLDELVMLENYIPRGMIGDQKKLIQGGNENGEKN